MKRLHGGFLARLGSAAAGERPPHVPRGTTGFTIGAQHGLPEAGRFSGEIAAVRFYEGYANRAEAERLAEVVKAANLQEGGAPSPP